MYSTESTCQGAWAASFITAALLVFVFIQDYNFFSIKSHVWLAVSPYWFLRMQKVVYNQIGVIWEKIKKLRDSNPSARGHKSLDVIMKPLRLNWKLIATDRCGKEKY